MMVVLYDAGTERVLASLELSCSVLRGCQPQEPSNAAMTAQVRSKQTLLPLAVVPVDRPGAAIVGQSDVTVILGDPIESLRSWILLLAAFDAIYWALCGLLYARVVED